MDAKATDSHSGPKPKIPCTLVEEDRRPGLPTRSDDVPTPSEALHSDKDSSSAISHYVQAPDLTISLNNNEISQAGKAISPTPVTATRSPESTSIVIKDSKTNNSDKVSGLSESGANHFLSESSRGTVTTSRDISGTDYSAPGTKLRLSNITEPPPAPASAPSPRQSTSIRETLFGSTQTKRKQRTSASATQAAPTDTVDLERGGGSLTYPQLHARSRDFPLSDSLSADDHSHQNRQEMIEREEREHLKRQIIYCVMFTILLFGGVGICVALQIHRTS